MANYNPYLSFSNLSICNENQNRTSQSGLKTGIALYPSAIWGLISNNEHPILTGIKMEISPHSGRFMPEQEEQDYFFLLASTRVGSIKLHDLLMEENPLITSKVLRLITSRVSETRFLYKLMTDPNGYYVFSKLVDSCNEPQLGLLVQNILKDKQVFIDITTDFHGSKLMKKLIRLLTGSFYTSPIVSRLSGVFFRVMTNQTGSYVVNSCLDLLDEHELTPLYKQALQHGLVLATDKVGCASLNYVIDKIQGPYREKLLGLVSENSVFLSKDPFGNYVVQKVLELGSPIFDGVIGLMLIGHYVKLSMTKWGSHVVEKCLKSTVAMKFVVEDFVGCGSSQLGMICRDRFGNYAIQTALEVTKERNRWIYMKLVERLKEQITGLRFGYGKNIYNVVVSEMENESIRKVCYKCSDCF